MASESFDLRPVDAIGVVTEGQPGERQFFLQVVAGAQAVTLACEKFHIQGLVQRIQQLLEAQGGRLEPAVPTPPAGPVQPEWAIAELGLGYNESKSLFVIVAREAVTDGDAADAATARFWLDERQLRGLAKQAEQVLASGRPLCQFCGLPIDPTGHPCPAANGSRPIF
jgi:uncharacterized repeat protein (TIGR03847 family)